MTYCPNCMHPTSGGPCPHCGSSKGWENSAGQLPVGTVIRGGGLNHSYQMGRALGQGGFGVTYIAVDLNRKQRVAIKEYFPSKCAQRIGVYVEPKHGMDAVYNGGRISFVKEAQMLASLEGMPSVVQGLDYLEVNGTAYLVMEYLDGTTLRQIVETNGKMLAEELLPKMEILMKDIHKLHNKNVVHRDIAPDNIMWMPDNTLKLLDFGCARSVEDGKSLTIMLKPGFAPLEQYQSKGQGAWTDVYALAATIYYCLTGVRPPVSTERLMEEIPLQSPISLGAALTPEEEEALLWGMELKAQERPINMDVFAQRLFPVPVPKPAPVPEPIPAPAVPRPNLIRRMLVWLREQFGGGR